MTLPTCVLRSPADGRVLFDTSALTFQLVDHGTVQVQARVGGNTNPGSALIPIGTSSNTRVVAVQSSFMTAKAGTYIANGQRFAHYACGSASGSVAYWVFEISANLQPSYPGLNIRNPATGQLVYSSDFDVMNVTSLLISDGSLNLDGSRAYAVAQMQFAGYRKAPESGAYYINGTPSRDTGGNYSSNTRWAYRNNGKLYGASVAGGSIQTGVVSWDDVIAQLNTGPRPAPFPPDWERPFGTALVLDVTNLD